MSTGMYQTACEKSPNRQQIDQWLNEGKSSVYISKKLMEIYGENISSKGILKYKKYRDEFIQKELEKSPEYQAKIKEVNEQFVDYNWTFQITDQKEYIINDEKYKGNGTYYFIIIEKNEASEYQASGYFAYFYHDTVRIYNAKSIIEVKKSECFVFNQIYSTNAFYFTIPTINQKESFHYQIKDINQNSEIIFAMSEKNSKEVKDITTSLTYIDQYTQIDPSSYYHIQVKAKKKDPSIGNVIEMCFTLDPTKAIPIEYNETEYEANMIAPTKIYYYLNITSIAQNKQGSLLLERSYQEATTVEPITVGCAETKYNSYSDIDKVIQNFKDESKFHKWRH